MTRSRNSYLYVFATYEEFQNVFPETATTVSSDIITNNVIPLREGESRGSYAYVAGVGLVDFSAGLAKILSQCKAERRFFSAVVNLGICGAYPNTGIKVGDVVNVISERVGDQGFQEKDGSFTSLSGNRIYGPSEKILNVPEAMESLFPFAKGLPQVAGLTVNCCTGTAELSAYRFNAFGCAVESMEGAAAFAICDAFGMPLAEIRAVSNMATVRDKSQWKIGEALENLRRTIDN